MENKKGMSAIIVAIILIALALAAVGIVWVVVNNVLTESAEDVNVQADCLDVDIVITKASCTSGNDCSYTISRKAGGNEFTGLKLVFSPPFK